MRRSIWAVAFVLAAGVTLVIASPANAQQPLRFLANSQDVTFPAGVCAFPVLAQVVEDKQVVQVFSDGRLQVTGHLVTRFVNLSDPSKSLVIVNSGPVFLTPNPDGTSSLKATGLNTIVFFPGDLGPGSPGGIFVISGLTMEQLDANFAPVPGSFTHSGDMLDLCAAIS